MTPLVPVAHERLYGEARARHASTRVGGERCKYVDRGFRLPTGALAEAPRALLDAPARQWHSAQLDDAREP